MADPPWAAITTVNSHAEPLSPAQSTEPFSNTRMLLPHTLETIWTTQPGFRRSYNMIIAIFACIKFHFIYSTGS
jgi:hypothetical protein